MGGSSLAPDLPAKLRDRKVAGPPGVWELGHGATQPKGPRSRNLPYLEDLFEVLQRGSDPTFLLKAALLGLGGAWSEARHNPLSPTAGRPDRLLRGANPALSVLHCLQTQGTLLAPSLKPLRRGMGEPEHWLGSRTLKVGVRSRVS